MKCYFLKERYYRLVSIVGVVGLLFFTIPANLIAYMVLALMFSISDVLLAVFCLFLFFASLVVSFYIFSAFFCLFMMLRKEINKTDAVNIIKYGQYPQHWYKPTVSEN